MKDLIILARKGESVAAWTLKYEKMTLYYLTNINPFRFAKCQEAELFRFFKGGIASCDVDARKPSPNLPNFTEQIQS